MAFRMPMKQIGVKNIGIRVDVMEWSDKMDLIAIANEKGEIIIQRLNWQKVIVFPPLAEGVKVKALAWQPGEVVIAAGYSNGKVSLLDIEKEDEIYSFTCESEVKTIKWKKTNEPPEITKVDPCMPPDEDYLQVLPNLSTFSSTSRKSDFCCIKTFEKNSPNFLIVSTKAGDVLISVFGLLPCGTIKIPEHVGACENLEVHDVQMGRKYDEIFVFISRDGNSELLVFENTIFSEYKSPLFKLAGKYGKIIDLISYISETIQCITESWETALLEMDNKLTKFANSQPDGSLSADFLELLVFGFPSEALEQFLLRDLTEKGLKKLGNSIELSYSTIQQLVIRPLHCATANLAYHLFDVKGCSYYSYKYSYLLEPNDAEEATRNAGSFLFKLYELQETITESVTDYKIFWCWLYTTIIRLMDENVPDDVASLSQDDIMHLAKFLDSFDDCIHETEDGGVVKRKFNLEKVGQYLEDGDLQVLPKEGKWDEFLNENECFKSSPIIIPHHRSFSLVKEFKNMKKYISEVFRRPNEEIRKNFVQKYKIKCSVNSILEEITHTGFLSSDASPDVFIATSGNNQLILIEMCSTDEIKVSKIQIANGQCQYEDMNNVVIKDMKLYNDKTLSLLLRGIFEGRQVDYFVQLDVSKWLSIGTGQKVEAEIDITQQGNVLCEFVDAECFSKIIDGTNCTRIAVSGSRKVASILSDNYRKIRLYEMEVEDEDDEMEPSINLFTSREVA